MPARTDHDRRDAQHAARSRIMVGLGQYVRRMTEMAYAFIEEEATRDHDGPVDWSAVGTASADRALAAFGVGSPQPAIEGTAKAVESGPARGAD